jgi:hypothetical protein
VAKSQHYSGTTSVFLFQTSWPTEGANTMEDDFAEDSGPSRAEEGGDNDSGEVIGSAAMRPVFLGNLIPGFAPEKVTDVFERPFQPNKSDKPYAPIPVDRLDQKRGYCFVFLKDAATQADKDAAERFVLDINGM